MKTAVIMGTRPEIIKLAPIIEKLPKSKNSVIFTGQHYDYSMGLRFIDQLGLRRPDYSLKLSKSNPTTQIGEIILKLSKILQEINPDTVIVQGDTNTVLASAITALKSGIPISHVESGLRSYDWRMPEEHNRIVTDHMSEFLFAPTKTSKKILINENVHGKSFVTGNTVIDSINKFSKLSSKKSSIDIQSSDYILMTLHRAENVDDKISLSSIIKAVVNSKENIIFPVHPRTIKKLHDYNLYNKLQNSKNISLIDSVGYFDMLELMKKSLFVITDSGGVQEEITSPNIKKKAIIVRKTTDRPESIESGFAQLVGVSYSRILSAIKFNVKHPTISSKKSPYGTGKASETIIKILRKNLRR